MIDFTVVIGYMYGKSDTVSSGETVKRSNTLAGRLVTAMQSLFLNVLEFFGLSISPATVNVALIILLIVTVFLIGEVCSFAASTDQVSILLKGVNAPFNYQDTYHLLTPSLKGYLLKIFYNYNIGKIIIIYYFNYAVTYNINTA